MPPSISATATTPRAASISRGPTISAAFSRLPPWLRYAPHVTLVTLGAGVWAHVILTSADSQRANSQVVKAVLYHLRTDPAAAERLGDDVRLVGFPESAENPVPAPAGRPGLYSRQSDLAVTLSTTYTSTSLSSSHQQQPLQQQQQHHLHQHVPPPLSTGILSTRPSWWPTWPRFANVADTVRGECNQHRGVADLAFRVVGSRGEVALVRYVGRRRVPPGDVWEAQTFVVAKEEEKDVVADGKGGTGAGGWMLDFVQMARSGGGGGGDGGKR